MTEASQRKYTIFLDLFSPSDFLDPQNQSYISSIVDQEAGIKELIRDDFATEIIESGDLFHLHSEDQTQLPRNSVTGDQEKMMADLEALYDEIGAASSRVLTHEVDWRFSKIEFLMLSGSHKSELISKSLGYGVIRLFIRGDESVPDYDDSTESDGTILAILAVPSYFSTPDLFGFIGDEGRNKVQHFRIFRSENPSRFMVLMKFKSREDAAEFQRKHDGREFSSLEPETCQVINVEKVMFRPSRLTSSDASSVMSSGEYPSSAKELDPALVELPTCPICLERMDTSISGLVTRSCAHTFHCNCLWKWRGGTCPVCRASSLEEKRRAHGRQRTCSVCSTTNNLWACLICGNIACGRYDSAHAVHHFKSTDHCYAIDLATQSVWDYAEDRYVHRLIRNEADGKVVELPSLDEKTRRNKNNNVVTDSASKNDSEALVTALLNIIQNGNDEFDEVKDKSNLQQAALLERIDELERMTNSHVSPEVLEDLNARHDREKTHWQTSLQQVTEKFAALDLKVAESETKIKQLQEDSKKSLQERDNVIVELRAQIQKLEQETVGGLEKALKASQRKVEELQSKTDDLRGQLAEERELSGALSKQIDHFSSQKAVDSSKSTDDIAKLRQMLQEKEEENRDLMFYLETLQKCEADPDLKDADIHIQQTPQQTPQTSRRTRSKKTSKRLL